MRSSWPVCVRSWSAAWSGGRAARAFASPAIRRSPAWQGKDLAAIAALEKKPAADIVLEIERNGGAQIVNFGMSEEDVRLIMRQPFVATASDGASMVPSADTVPHPRSYGCFPRKIGRYAIEDKILPLEQAIRSSSGLARGHSALTGARLSEAGLLRRRGRLRSQDVPRHGDVRQAAPVRDRRAVSVRQRPAGDRRRQVHGRAGGQGAAAQEQGGTRNSVHRTVESLTI